jgi:hypothetical protein
MSYVNVQIDPLRSYLILSAKRAAKTLGKASPLRSHSSCLDQIASFTGRSNWSLLAKHIAGADGDLLVRIAHKLCPQFRLLGIPDFEGAEELMREWVVRTFTPLIDFAYYDKESANGYAWPDVELAHELYGEFGGICGDELIEAVASDLELSHGPWGLEDYGAPDEDDE